MEIKVNKIAMDAGMGKEIFVVSIKSECGYNNITLTKDEVKSLGKKMNFIVNQENFGE